MPKMEPPSARSQFEQLFLKFATDVTREVLDHARPSVVKWVNEQAIPTVMAAGSAVASAAASVATSAWRNVAAIGRGREHVVHVESTIGPAESEPAVEPAPAAASHDVAAVLEAYRAGMSRTEARQLIVVALASNLFTEQQRQVVRAAGSDDNPEPDAATVTLTEQQLGESVQLMLETTPSLLSEQSLNDLREILETSA